MLTESRKAHKKVSNYCLDCWLPSFLYVCFSFTLQCIWSSRPGCCLQHSAEVVLGRILFQGRVLSCSWRINPGKPLVCPVINLCGTALPEGTHAHIQTQVHNNTRDDQCFRVVWSERTISTFHMLECLMALSLHNDVFVSEVINVFWTTPPLVPGSVLTQLIYALKRCPEGSLYSTCVYSLRGTHQLAVLNQRLKKGKHVGNILMI